MCLWGDTVDVEVPIPENLSHTGEFRWEKKPIDSCLVPLINALNNAGIYTASCCCGHGKSDGSVILHDGRTLVIRDTEEYLKSTRINRHRKYP